MRLRRRRALVLVVGSALSLLCGNGAQGASTAEQHATGEFFIPYSLLAAKGGGLTVSGSMTAPHYSLQQTRIKTFDGTTWGHLDPVPSGQSGLTALSALSGSNVWAAGWYAGTNSTPLVAHFDGLHWKVTQCPVPSGDVSNPGFTSISALKTNDVWAVGLYWVNDGATEETLVEHWDGTSWKIEPGSGSQGILYGITALSPTNVFAVGTFADGFLEHWDGSSWTTVKLSGPPATLDAVWADSPTDIWAAGGPWQSAQQAAMVHFDGDKWTSTPIGGPDPYNYITAVNGTGPHDVWAVGAGQQLNFGASTELIEHWDGNAWTVTASPQWSDKDSTLWSVSAVTPTDAWAVGMVGSIDTQIFDPLLLHWNGKRWKRMDMRNRAGDVRTPSEPRLK